MAGVAIAARHLFGVLEPPPALEISGQKVGDAAHPFCFTARDQECLTQSQVGNFLRGIECNEHGIGLRHGCHDEVELVVRLDRIETMTEVSDG